MKNEIILFLIISLFLVNSAYSQEQKTTNPNELVVSDTDLIIIFSGFIISIIAILLYLARHQIYRIRTDNNKEEFESENDKDFEKYHSEWTSDDYIGKKIEGRDSHYYRKSLHDSNFPNYYKILKINKDATRDEIKKQFRKLVKEWHPDRNPDTSTKEKMAEINEAYEVLSDVENRKNYDKYFDGA